jgi:DNA-binding transcriptional MerR regulator
VCSAKENEVEEVSIGEFARRSRLSVKALRLYDEQGVLIPARVDASSGYRYYAVTQLEDARLIAMLRQLDMPLATIRELLALPRADAAALVEAHWRTADTAHDARRELAVYLIDQLNGKRSSMYEVKTREMPERSVLCLKRNVDEAGAWALGKEFIAIMRERPAPTIPGIEGASFFIFWGEVSDDSDGPAEWCRPVLKDGAETLALQYPEFVLRTEPAHTEAFVDMDRDVPWGPVQSQLAMEALFAWAKENGIDKAKHDLQPEDLGMRITYLWSEPIDATKGPEGTFAVPYALSPVTR